MQRLGRSRSEITIATSDFGRVTLVNRNIKVLGVASGHFEWRKKLLVPLQQAI